MLSWFSNKSESHRAVFPSAGYRSKLSENLKRMYNDRLLPLEDFYHFHDFHSFRIEDSEFNAKPMVLLIGQYSTGKTTFIKTVIEQDYPGMRIGPEPTTDNFVIVSDGQVDSIVPGNALVSDKTMPFCPLARFGNAFLNRLQMSVTPNPVLENITFVDTPGVTSGTKHQKLHRGYDFTEVVAWFASHADRIILFIDACKLDISDEMKKILEIVRENDEKLKVVFNKADMLSGQELMRGYGALMWFLGRALPSPEPCRVFIASFSMSEMMNDDHRKLLEMEAQDLYQDLQTLPRNSAIRKVNDIIKRARAAVVHAYIMSELHQSMRVASSIFGGKRFSILGIGIGQNRRSREALLDKLPEIYEKLERRKDLSFGNFPKVPVLRERLLSYDFELKLQPLKEKLIQDVESMLASDANRLMSALICGRPSLIGGLDDSPDRDHPMSTSNEMTSENCGPGVQHQLSNMARGATLAPGVSLAPLGMLKNTPFAPGRYEGLDAGSDCFTTNKSAVSSRDGTLDTNKSSQYKPSGGGNPFGSSSSCDDLPWGIDAIKRARYSQIFSRIAGDDGKATGVSVRDELLKTKLPNTVLAKIWRLSDMDGDHCLDEDEFALAMYLVEMKIQGFELPNVGASGDQSSRSQKSPLPIHLIPPSKRHLLH